VTQTVRNPCTFLLDCAESVGPANREHDATGRENAGLTHRTEKDEPVLLSARKILLIHFLMRLPDFVRPAVDAADRFVQRFVKSKFFGSVTCTALVKRPISPRRLHPRSRGRMPQRLPRSKAQEG